MLSADKGSRMDTEDSQNHVESISLIASDNELQETDQRVMERPISHNFEGMAEFSCGNTRKWPVTEGMARASIVKP